MTTPKSKYDLRDPRTQTAADRAYGEALGPYFRGSIGDDVEKLRNFTKYVPRQTLSMFLAKAEIFNRIVGIHGHIIECGVFLGGGLLTWAQLSAIHEPYNFIRRIVGFDTFSGFSELSEMDQSAASLPHAHRGGLAAPAFDDLTSCLELYDLNRPLGHIPRVEMVRGDAVKTIPEYVQTNKHVVVSLLYLDFDLYEPTKAALEAFLPRMPKGAILAFDELNQSAWPGETLAVLDTVGLRNLKIERFPYVPQLSYAVLE